MSTSLNVFRWSALATGIVYGAYHTQQLKVAGKINQDQFNFARRQNLIKEAKLEYSKLNPSQEDSKNDLAKINLDDDKLDFANVLLRAVESLNDN
ncbi:F1F0 ATP synthase subunit e, mitochondrial [Komagataella phaffii CBS 7435]|uniref:ATP synthase F(0) complex subunit e, mitochondrial n=2 Tax=Komagataella phaffii TaxID=460519 RepID=C4R987_KOMPG|nr:mitochondrial ATP synthase [Komagataella phaffii GS115]KAI0460763.1 hypothetical protein LJB42_001621 [Komagataella kurtzmanii]CAH2450381.1 F1F0 ATP synthase subunit e, mitochondrial [Komagataella phaffii CBS 7435]CAY72162.1 mitochondrial ATP synthase [Komagataella phaffii GS115]CCA40239.1 F1F0 ATP synthase subunit e, mitochondrial [Komagataella phaffii CBS 7435]